MYVYKIIKKNRQEEVEDMGECIIVIQVKFVMMKGDGYESSEIGPVGLK